MPMITICFTALRPRQEVKPEIAKAISSLAKELLHKEEKATAVLVEEAYATDWFCGGRSLAEAKLASFWLDIRITDGTNTKDEKATFISAAFQTMGEILGPLHEASYVHVHDVRADGWGFGGLSQERRYIGGKLSASALAD
jgi:4-oxalocrotonate tautomerase